MNARRALAEALPNLIYLAAVAGVVLVFTHRDALSRAWARLEAYRGRGPDGADVAVLELRRAIADYEHGGGT